MVGSAEPDFGYLPEDRRALHRMITKQHWGRLRQEYARTQNMSLTALRADVDRKTARKYVQCNQTPAELQEPHSWRTRADPLEKVWPVAEKMLTDVPELEAKTLFDYFLGQPGNGLEESHLRTFQRRVQHWRGTHGPEQDVMFDQRRQPGELLQIDWTHPGELEVSVQGQPLEHLLCHGVLAYSNWQWASRCQSESFLSLVAGFQACVGKLGRVPRHLSTDNSSAATHEIESGKRSYNPDYLDLCDHYSISPVTINVACPNEQGDVESANRHLKRRIDQQLLLRGSRDFASPEAYDGFVGGILEAANARRERHVIEELNVMRAPPPTVLAAYRELRVRVSSNSTIRVKNISYSVSSRLIGQAVRVEQYEAEIVVYLGREVVERFPRQRGDRGAKIDFRHVIGPLLRKPGAFLNYQHREQLYPSAVYRGAFDQLVAGHGTRTGVIEYLQVLKLAAAEGVEVVERLLVEPGRKESKWRAMELERVLQPRAEAVLELEALTPELSSYDTFLESEVSHVA